jgi:hypothetical protein
LSIRVLINRRLCYRQERNTTENLTKNQAVDRISLLSEDRVVHLHHARENNLHAPVVASGKDTGAICSF